MSVKEVVSSRKIKEVLHFTTHGGLLGTLHARAVKSRKRLPADVNLEFIYRPNAVFRKDLDWLDFVNLSISRINVDFFNSSCRWRREEDLWWCILAFDPEIMSKSGVYFTTTNNMYTGCLRGPGATGLSRLFAPTIERWAGNIVRRNAALPDAWTTCVQAEVLYPGELPISYLRRVYVQREDDQDEVYAQLHMLGIEHEVLIEPSKFLPQGI
jgi:ssDNA thymidine ADP-ribosyltransferase, DarT